MLLLLFRVVVTLFILFLFLILSFFVLAIFVLDIFFLLFVLLVHFLLQLFLDVTLRRLTSFFVSSSPVCHHYHYRRQNHLLLHFNCLLHPFFVFVSFSLCVLFRSTFSRSHVLRCNALFHHLCLGLLSIVSVSLASPISTARSAKQSRVIRMHCF